MNQAPRHQFGRIEPYRDVLGRTQTAVTGPHGHVLITKGTEAEPYRVWHSDSLGTLATTRDRARALQIACEAAGVTL